MQPALRAAAALLALCLGCAGGQSEEFCNDNADCETRLTCFQNRCLLLEPVPVGLIWEIAPASQGLPMSLATTQRTQPLTLRHCEASAVGDASELGSVRVDVEGATRGLDGVCVREQQVVEGNFSIPLAPGRWRLTFHPTNAPPIVRNIEIVGCAPFPLGPIRAREQASLRFLPIQSADDPQPRCGIRAQAFDIERGEPLSHPLSLALGSDHRCRPPRPEGWELQVARPQDGLHFALVLETEDVAAPVMRQKVVHLEWAPDEPVPVVIDTESRPAERVLLDLGDPDGQPVDGARIQASWPWRDDDDCLGKRFPGAAEEDGAFRSAVARPTSAPGGYELWLPPGPHLFRVIPPAATDLAAKTWQEPATVREGGGNVLLLRLDRKPNLEGTVFTDPGREPLSDARVRALPLRAPGRMVEVRADAQGFYRLRLDPGPYLLLADPPGRRLPRIWSFVELGEMGTHRVDLGIDPARVIAGHVRGEEGPLPHALVRAWDVGGDEPVVAGEAMTDAAGRFVLRLRR